MNSDPFSPTRPERVHHHTQGTLIGNIIATIVSLKNYSVITSFIFLPFKNSYHNNAERLFYHFHNAVERVTDCMPGTSLQTYLPKISVSLFHVQHKGMLLACILAFFPHTRQTCSKQCTAIASSDMAYSDAYCTQQKRVSKYMTLLVYRSNLTFTAGTVIES